MIYHKTAFLRFRFPASPVRVPLVMHKLSAKIPRNNLPEGLLLPLGVCHFKRLFPDYSAFFFYLEG